jgi:UDP:flavonoid glycosyltransferase YjiC (YdhE family)
MSHIGVVAPPFFSHFHALEALAGELMDRGHRVSFFHQSDARASLRDPRSGFQALGHGTHPPGSLMGTLRRAASPAGPIGLRRVIDDLARTTDMLCGELPAAIETNGVDALLCDQMEPAGGMVAEALGLPFVSVACALPIDRETAVPLPVMPFGHAVTPVGLRICEGSTRVYDWLMGPCRQVIERRSRQLGIAPRGAMHECLSPYAQVSQTIDGFDFPRAAPPAGLHAVGPLRRGAEADAPLPWPVDTARPFVFASLGTLQGHRVGLLRRIATACRQQDVQLLVAHCGGLDASQAAAVQRAGPVDATWVTDFAPQRAVLRQADAVITHGGLNTVMDAIESRTPMLALPIAFDQPGVAARIRHAGIGLSASHRAPAGVIGRRLRRVLDDGSHAPRLAALAAQLASAGGARRAADIVETVIRTRAPVTVDGPR